MRTDRSFHGFFTLAPRPATRVLMRRRHKGSPRIFRRLDVKCICANLRDLWETTKRPMRLKKHVGEFAHRSRGATQMPYGMIGGSHRSHGATQMPCGVIGQTTDRTAGAADRHRFYRMRRVVWENVTRRGLIDMRSNKHAPDGGRSP